MTIEIEIKFIATPDAASELPTQLTAWPHEHSAAEKLTNIYYETKDAQLRRWDMGLRIRGFGDSYEMTLKTAGQSVGGLHQRQEYNIPLTQPDLAIEKLPQTVWPAGTDLSALQAQLTPLFSTHFLREKWVVTYRESVIEVASDRGEVRSGELTEAINEIELELKSGHQKELLAFAAELAGMGGLRLGSLSKAARGYALAQGNPARERRPLPILKAKPKATIEEGMQSAFALGLAQWQYHEELWLSGNHDALQEIRQALETLRQAFTLFGSLVPRKASSDLRQRLAVLEETLKADDLHAETLCFAADSLLAQLALTNWIATQGWRDFVSAEADVKLQASFKRFSDIMLGRIAADLKSTFDKIRHINEYQDKLPRLNHQLLAVRLLAGAYEPSAVYSWLSGWERLALAIETHDRSWLENAGHDVLRTPAFWKNGSL
ncbi:CYTH domain-containing protein [Erwinia oleae]|uniref:CYTH domain-containing protein n=1 Tax=Erwinia oleae TaxID=796334 RepID=UPI000553BDC3|nr:inorganic triphosphatase [Erwinia oleae]